MQEKDGGLLTDAMRDFISYDDNTPIAYMRATIKQIQKDVWLKGKEIDGIIWPKTEATITQYFQKLKNTSTQKTITTKTYTSKSKDWIDASRTEQNKQPKALTKRNTQLTTHNEKIQKIHTIKNLNFKQKRDFMEKFDMNQTSTDELIVLYYTINNIWTPLDWNIDSNNPLNQRLKQKILTELLPIHINHNFENSPNLTLNNQQTSLSFQTWHGYDIQIWDQKYAIIKNTKSWHIELHHITAVGSTSPQEVILTKNSPRHVISEPNHWAIQNEMVKWTVLTLQDDGHVLVQDFNSIHRTTIKTLSDS